MDRELLRLGLVNHALHFDVEHDVAWALVDNILENDDGARVQALADRVRVAAVEHVYGAPFMQPPEPVPERNSPGQA
jgi:hypothetical protein